MRKWMYGLCIAVFVSQISAADPDDYAYRAELTESPDQLQRVELPIDVLINLTSHQLQDIAVFDYSGKALPHTVQKALQQNIKKEADLTFHVFDRFQKQHSKIITKREQSEQDGELTSLETTQTVETQQRRQDYLIELPNSPSITDLELGWIQQPTNQLLQVKLEVGTNLDNLRSIDNNKVISNVNPSAPEWRFIRNIPRGQKYLRITVANNIESFELKRVTGHYQERQAQRKLWHSVETAPTNIEKKSYLNFKTPSVVIPGALRLTPAEPYSAIRGNLYASQSDFEHKQSVSSRFYQHNIEADEVKPSQPITLPNRQYQQWWLSLDQQPETMPSIELAYPIYELIFLTNGSGPYTLAWGNYQSQPQTSNLADITTADLNQNEQRGKLVSLKTMQVGGGTARLAAESELPWKQWALWALLILAALVTGRMAYGLYREMGLK